MSNIARKQHLFATLTPLWHTASHTNMLKPKSAAEPKINNKYIRHHYKMAKTANVLCRVQQTNEIITATTTTWMPSSAPHWYISYKYPGRQMSTLCINHSDEHHIKRSSAHSAMHWPFSRCRHSRTFIEQRNTIHSPHYESWVTTAWKSHGEGE